MTFSSRSDWHRQPNKLAQLLDERRRRGKPIYDLTLSNPTDAGVEYPAESILRALTRSEALLYRPDALGLPSARKAVADYYAVKGTNVSPSNIILTASSSEAYSYLFKLLCNVGDDVLVPTPSYPLFEFLAQLNDVRLRTYHLRYDGEWHIDIESVKRAITARTRAIIVVSPHNPTGMVLKKDEFSTLSNMCAAHDLALIVDEVFADFIHRDDDRHVRSTADHAAALTFTLNGISKSCGLPQLKLGWIVVSGDQAPTREALQRLEIIADTYLSVNTPVQAALADLLREGAIVCQRIHERVRGNLALLKEKLVQESPINLLSVEAGWYAVLRMPNTMSEEERVIRLLDETGVYLFPGYFFEFQESGYLVLSLLAECATFAMGIEEIRRSLKA